MTEISLAVAFVQNLNTSQPLKSTYDFIDGFHFVIFRFKRRIRAIIDVFAGRSGGNFVAATRSGVQKGIVSSVGRERIGASNGVEFTTTIERIGIDQILNLFLNQVI